jgi:Skp family chaperone for outer membrane proteins
MSQQVDVMRSLALCTLCCGALAFSPAVSAAESPCATADADVILRTSSASRAAQNRLMAEFKPQFDAIEPLTRARHLAEGKWMEARRSSAPSAEQDPLKVDFEKAQLAERRASQPLREALERRKREELKALVARIDEIYPRLGRAQGFKLLFQRGEADPVFILEPSFQRASCGEPVDLTAQIIEQLDPPPPEGTRAQ